LIQFGKVGDYIFRETKAKNLLLLIERHFNQTKQPIKKAKEQREVFSICRGELLIDPEFK
jgi:hypothetical protein